MMVGGGLLTVLMRRAQKVSMWSRTPHVRRAHGFADITPLSITLCMTLSINLAGIANNGIGIALIHHLQDDAVAYWVGPTAAVLGAILVAGLVLEVVRSKVGVLSLLPFR